MKKTILVIDDFASVRYYHSSLLQNAGYTPLAAAGGAEALALLDQHPIDLIMLDLVMPSMSGGEFVRRLRAQPRHARLPVLIITGELDPAALAHFSGDSACHILTKPILPGSLLQAVSQQLG